MGNAVVGVEDSVGGGRLKRCGSRLSRSMSNCM